MTEQIKPCPSWCIGSHNENYPDLVHVQPVGAVPILHGSRAAVHLVRVDRDGVPGQVHVDLITASGTDAAHVVGLDLLGVQTLIGTLQAALDAYTEDLMRNGPVS